MIKKKGNFSTFIFSLLPGAGQMYLGFMKLGSSLMTAFFGVIFIASFLNIGPILFLIPIIWCYGFFDALNKNSLSDEEFYSLEDSYLFNKDIKLFNDFKGINLGKFRIIIAGVLIFIGGNMILENFLDFFHPYLSRDILNTIYNITHSLPQLIFALIIIYVGVRLIIGKKKELDKKML